MSDYKNIPKLDLHIHLEGSVRPERVANILDNPYLDKVTKLMRVNKDTKSPAAYNKKYDLPNRCMQSKKNIKLIANDLANDLKEDGVLYAEVRITLKKHMDEGLKMSEILNAALDGSNKVPGIKIKYILCMQREDNEKANRKIIRLAKLYKHFNVVGVDLIGNERKYPNKMFYSLFEYANKMHVNLFVHANKNSNLSIEEITKYNIKRIGHGSSFNQEIKDNLKKLNIPLEICINSDIDKDIFSNYQKHPIKDLIKDSIPFVIGTNCRTISNITLSKEYTNLKNYLDIKDSWFTVMNLNAIEYTMLNNSDKEKLRERFNKKIRS